MRGARAPRQDGFTLIELMAVVVIMGSVLLLVPVNLDSFGARGRLKSTANSLVAAFNGARERAILDAYEISLEIGSYRDDEGEWVQGWRYKFTNVPAPESGGDGSDPDQAEAEELRAQEREWLFTTWHKTGDGVRIVGVSERKGVWNKLHEGGKPYPIRFFADGNVEHGVAIRIESLDLETDREDRTATIILNALTSEPSWQEGEGDLKEARPASDFGN